MPRNVFQDTGDQKDFENSLEDETLFSTESDDTPIPELNLRELWEKETGFTTTADVLIEQQKRRQEESQ